MGFLVWIFSLVLLAVPWLIIRFVPVEVNEWASIYLAGALGGLVLEFVLGTGSVELPSVTPRDAEKEKKDERSPLGTQFDLGFFARVTSSGLAAVGILLVYYALVEGTDTERLSALGAEPETFGWAILLGVSSPAVWAAAKKLVEARLGAVQSKNDELLKAFSEVKGRIEEARGTGAQREVAAPAVPVDTTVELLKDSATPVLAEVADAQPGSVDVDAAFVNLREAFSTRFASWASSEPTSPAPDVTQALDEALGIVKSQLGDR